MIGVMTELSGVLGGNRVVVELPDADMDEWAAAVEVCIQEGMSAVALPVTRPQWLLEAVLMFGQRAVVGVWGVRTAEQAREAVGAGARFLTCPIADRTVVEAADGIPVILGGLTPSEVAHAAGLGASGVQVIPADAVSSAYSRSLSQLVPGIPLMASGRLEKYHADAWLKAGADAVCLTGMIITDEQLAKDSGLDLADVRRRARSYKELKALTNI